MGLHCWSSGSSKTVEEDPLYDHLSSKKRGTPTENAFSHSPSLFRFLPLCLLHHPHLILLLFLLFFLLLLYTPFIGTPGIIRSEFVFSRSCAVLPVGAYHRSDRRLTIGPKQEDENGNGDKERVTTSRNTEDSRKSRKRTCWGGFRGKTKTDFMLELHKQIERILWEIAEDELIVKH